MKNDGLKILVNLLQITLMILAVLTWDRQLIGHVFIGVAFVLLSIVHVRFFRKRLKLLGQVFNSKALKGEVRRQYQIDLVLLIFWGIAIVCGLLNFLTGGSESELIYGHIHGIAARVAALLTVFHGFMHSKQFSNYFSGKSG